MTAAARTLIPTTVVRGLAAGKRGAGRKWSVAVVAVVAVAAAVAAAAVMWNVKTVVVVAVGVVMVVESSRTANDVRKLHVATLARVGTLR